MPIRWCGRPAVVDFELQELVGFGNLLAFEYLAHADVEFGKVVEFDGRGDGLGYMVGLFVGNLRVVQFLDLGLDNAVVDFLEKQFGLRQLGAGCKNVGAAQHVPVDGCKSQHGA